MKWKIGILCILLILSLLTTGCTLGTIEELYCQPKRSEEYENLQAVIDKAMSDLEYCSPSYGEYPQAQQTADLDGDGIDEYLVFAKDNSDKPLKILIFCQLASGYVLMDTIEGYGFGYDFVDYAQMDDKPGVELIVGRQVGEQVLRAVSVYRFTSGFSRQLLSATYAQIATVDLEADGISEIFLLSPGASPMSYGSARLYCFADGELQPSMEMLLSASISGFKQLVTSTLSDGRNAIYVTSASTSQKLVTDIFTVENSQLISIAAGLITDTLHNYFVLPDDIDGNGVLELPRLIPLNSTEGNSRQEYLVEWYSLDSAGTQMIRMRTYHNMMDNWYLELSDRFLEKLAVQQIDDGCIFYVDGVPAFTIFALKDADREEQSKLPNRIILYSSESVIYAAEISDGYSDFETAIKKMFHPIRVNVNTERD